MIRGDAPAPLALLFATHLAARDRLCLRRLARHPLWRAGGGWHGGLPPSAVAAPARSLDRMREARAPPEAPRPGREGDVGAREIGHVISLVDTDLNTVRR